MEEKGIQQESNAAASSADGEPAVVIEGVPDIIASNSTIPPSDAVRTDTDVVIDGLPDIIGNDGTIPPGGASSAESAIVINKALDMIPSNRTLPSGDASCAAEMQVPSGLGKWMIGRKVRKWFKGRYYAGDVTKFDNWYRVLYEDGDSEDLDWQELEELLVPSETKVPLKKLAKRVIRENKKSARKSGKKVAHSQIPK